MSTETTPKPPYMSLSSETWWLKLDQEVICPECKEQVHLCIKRGSMEVIYNYHSLKNTSGFINPHFYQINVIACKMSRKPFVELNDLTKLKGYYTKEQLREIKAQKKLANKTSKDTNNRNGVSLE